MTVSDTVEWLDDHKIPYRDICFLGDKPEVGADCYIDDAPHNVHALRAGGSDVIVFDQPYNRDLEAPQGYELVGGGGDDHDSVLQIRGRALMVLADDLLDGAGGWTGVLHRLTEREDLGSELAEARSGRGYGGRGG